MKQNDEISQLAMEFIRRDFAERKKKTDSLFRNRSSLAVAMGIKPSAMKARWIREKYEPTVQFIYTYAMTVCTDPELFMADVAKFIKENMK